MQFVWYNLGILLSTIDSHNLPQLLAQIYSSPRNLKTIALTVISLSTFCWKNLAIQEYRFTYFQWSIIFFKVYYQSVHSRTERFWPLNELTSFSSRIIISSKIPCRFSALILPYNLLRLSSWRLRSLASSMLVRFSFCKLYVWANISSSIIPFLVLFNVVTM